MVIEEMSLLCTRHNVKLIRKSVIMFPDHLFLFLFFIYPLFPLHTLDLDLAIVLFFRQRQLNFIFHFC